MDSSLNRFRHYMVFDTETTALVSNSLLAEPHQPEIIEFYAMIVDGLGELKEELHFLCKPKRPISKEVSAITHITDEMVIDERPFGFYFDRVLGFMKKCDGIVAHNLSFDMDMINIEAARLGRLGDIKYPKIKICTVEATEWIKGHRMNLSDLHEYLFGERFANAHRAKEDVGALGRIFNELMKRGDI